MTHFNNIIGDGTKSRCDDGPGTGPRHYSWQESSLPKSLAHRGHAGTQGTPIQMYVSELVQGNEWTRMTDFWKISKTHQCMSARRFVARCQMCCSSIVTVVVAYLEAYMRFDMLTPDKLFRRALCRVLS